MALLIKTLATVISPKPLLSVNFNVNVCTGFVARPGLTLTTPGPETCAPAAPHVANACHPEFEDASCAATYNTLFPAKEGVKLIFLKNENYFESSPTGRLPFLDAIEVSFLSDKQSAFIEFLKGNLDFLNSIDASYKDELLTRTGQLQSPIRKRLRRW